MYVISLDVVQLEGVRSFIENETSFKGMDNLIYLAKKVKTLKLELRELNRLNSLWKGNHAGKEIYSIKKEIASIKKHFKQVAKENDFYFAT